MAKKNKQALSEGVLYHLETTLTYIIVCASADWDADRVQAETNKKDRPGTANNEWVIEKGTEQAPNGLPCDQDANRRHWVLVC